MAGRKSTEKTDKGAVQLRILDAAELQFAGNSFAGARVGEIATSAGVNQALIHYYFQSKEGLYEAVLARLFAKWEDMIADHAWEEWEAEQIIRRYVELHYRIRCELPNLFHIITWGASEGGELFRRYAPPGWAAHFDTVRQALRRRQADGQLKTDMNVSVFLHTLWGMMEHFYYRSAAYLQNMVGSDEEAETIHAQIADQIIRQSLSGILLDRTQAPSKGAVSGEGSKLFMLRAYVADETTVGEADEVLEAVLRITGRTVVWLDLDKWQQTLGDDEAGEPLFIIASTRYGEIPDEMVSLLVHLERMPDEAAARFVGVWTLGALAAGDSAQRTMEEALNRIGAYAVTRVPGQVAPAYIRRFARLLHG